MKIYNFLNDFDDAYNADGSQKIVSLKFIAKDGVEHFIPNGIKCGLNVGNMQLFHLRGIQPVKILKDGKIIPISNPKSFRWYLITFYDNKKGLKGDITF